MAIGSLLFARNGGYCCWPAPSRSPPTEWSAGCEPATRAHRAAAVGGQAMIWLAWPWGVAGTLGPTAARSWSRWCGAWSAGPARAAGQLPARHRRNGPAGHLGAAVRELHRADDLPGQRRRPDLYRVRHRRVRRYRRIRRGCAVRQHLLAPEISPKKSIEGLGGSRCSVSLPPCCGYVPVHQPPWVGRLSC